tara:strand:+ start:574 stop:1836 length:1263 start_codon:yes stop_codon:yes gene_type:complete
MEYLLDINNLDKNSLSNLKLHSPIPIQGGSYLAKITLNDNPVLFQMPKCSTKKGIVSSGKRFYCDLLFKYDDSNVIDFIDEMETIIRSKVLEKNELWFQDPPSLEDIEYNWNESVKQTKQHFYLRTYIGNTKNIKSTISVYNSNQEQISMDDITSSSKIITIIELTGLKFSSSSFHINYCLRQVMVLEDKPIFNKCLINFSNNKNKANNSNEPSKNKVNNLEIKDETINKNPDVQPTIELKIEESVNVGEKETSDVEDDDLEILNNASNNLSEEFMNKNDNLEFKEKKPEDLEKTENLSDPVDEIKEENKHLEELVENSENKDNETIKINTDLNDNQEKEEEDLEIREVELEMPQEKEMFELKKPDTVYLDMYNKALQKAKEAKIKAIQAYLELKEIKNKYMIEEVDNDDDNFSDFNLEF